MKLGKVFSEICGRSLITYHRRPTNGEVFNAPLNYTLTYSVVFKSLSLSEFIHVPVFRLVFFILMSRKPFLSRMFVISAVAVHADSIHALSGHLSAAGICAF